MKNTNEKIERLNRFYTWLYDTVKNIHVINDQEFERINEKLKC